MAAVSFKQSELFGANKAIIVGFDIIIHIHTVKTVLHKLLIFF